MTIQIGSILSPMQLTAVIWADPTGGYCSLNLETGTTTQGESVEEALANLEEATSLYLEEFPLEGKPHISGAFVTTFTIPHFG
jgi:predicted RNase H-like HicB family nuclease